MKHIWFILVFLPVFAFGQCKDTVSPVTTPNSCLGGGFIPVCGCDGVTYRNSCYAEIGANLFQWSEGPCESVAVNIYPNPTSYWLYAEIATKYESDVNLYIFDRNGNIAYSNNLSNVTNTDLTIPVNNLGHGVYIMMAECNGYNQLLKFVRWEQ